MEAGEDFYKFKKDFYDAAKANRTSLKNQTTKLRENLRGYAKSLVAASVTDVDKAFKILENACGDTMDVVNFRVNNLLKVGQWPAEGTRDCYTKQVRWLVKVQALIQEIIDLADTEEELAAVIYNREKLTQIMRLFPPFMVDKLGAIPGYKQEKYLAVIRKLDDWKTISQNREKIYGTSSSSNQDRAQTKSATPAQVPSGHTNYKQPKNLPSCRICQALKNQGVNISSYDGHVSDYATGCPRFAALSTDERMVIAREAKYCVNCMGKDIKYSMKHSRKCAIKTK